MVLEMKSESGPHSMATVLRLLQPQVCPQIGKEGLIGSSGQKECAVLPLLLPLSNLVEEGGGGGGAGGVDMPK